MTDKDMIEAMGEALEQKNYKIRELSRELGRKAKECRELRSKLTLTECENVYLKRKLEALTHE